MCIRDSTNGLDRQRIARAKKHSEQNERFRQAVAMVDQLEPKVPLPSLYDDSVNDVEWQAQDCDICYPCQPGRNDVDEKDCEYSSDFARDIRRRATADDVSTDCPPDGESGVDDIMSKLGELDDPENKPKKKEKKSDDEEDTSGMDDVLGKLDEL